MLCPTSTLPHIVLTTHHAPTHTHDLQLFIRGETGAKKENQRQLEVSKAGRQAGRKHVHVNGAVGQAAQGGH